MIRRHIGDLPLPLAAVAGFFGVPLAIPPLILWATCSGLYSKTFMLRMRGLFWKVLLMNVVMFTAILWVLYAGGYWLGELTS